MNTQFSNVLVVDDSKSARLFLGRILQQMDKNVESVDSAEEALQKLQDFQPDLILMDHLMPGMDGFEALSHIRAMSQHGDTPVVMCTSKEDEDYDRLAGEAGADGVMLKPPTPEGLGLLLSRLEAGQSLRATAPAAAEPPAPKPVPAAEAALDEEAIASRIQAATQGLRADLLQELQSVVQQAAAEQVRHNAPDVAALEARLQEDIQQRVADLVPPAVASQLQSAVGEINADLKRAQNERFAEFDTRMVAPEQIEAFQEKLQQFEGALAPLATQLRGIAETMKTSEQRLQQMVDTHTETLEGVVSKQVKLDETVSQLENRPEPQSPGVAVPVIAAVVGGLVGAGLVYGLVTAGLI